MTKILYSELTKPQAREKLIAGVNAVANHVKKTLGPKGRNIIIEQKFGSPQATKDGVTVARAIDLEDPAENLGAQLCIMAAEKTVDEVGDGTTATCVLVQSILNAANKLVVAGHNPVDIKRGIDYACEKIVEKLKQMAIPVGLDDSDRLSQVAAIASNGDENVGKIIAETLKKVGADGIVTVEQSNSTDTEVEEVEGMQFDRGYISPYFINDAESMECVLEDPYILLYDKKFSDLRQIDELTNLFRQMQQGEAKPILVIAEDVEGLALAFFTGNARRGILRSCAVKAPAYGSRMKDNLSDIAVMTGGTVIDSEQGLKLSQVTLSMLGQAKKVRVSQDYTTIIDGAGLKADVDARIKEIKARIEKSTESFDKEKQQERLARLAAGMAIIRVGGRTEVAMKELCARVEDALMATKAAISEGVVPGGGMALLNIAIEGIDTSDEHLKDGAMIVLEACKEPFNQIVRNAGFEPAEVRAKLPDGKDFGYDASRDNYVTMVNAGIIDPVKVVRCSLENAVSVAGQLLLAEGTIHEKREPLTLLNPNPDDM